MKVLALLEDLEGASARLRLLPFLGWLEARGARVTAITLPSSGPARWRVLARAAEYDSVVLQRRLLKPWESVLLGVRARRLVVELDDALWRRDRPPFESAWRRLEARCLWRAADVVVAGSPSLARELASLGVDAVVVPTPVVAESASEEGAAPPSAAPPVVAWIGQPATWRYAAPRIDRWVSVASSGRARLVVMGAPEETQESLREAGIDGRRWTPEGELALLREAAIGLAPLDDDPWTRGKCGARHLRFLAAGVPVIASAVGEQADLAAEFGGTRLVQPGGDWAEPLLELVQNAAERHRLGLGLAKRVAAVRRLDAVAVQFEALVRGVAGAPGGR